MSKLSLLLALAIPAAALAAEPKSPRLNAVSSWVGNTYPGNPQWVQQDIEAMCVTPEGLVFTNVEWDEGGGQAGAYKDGNLLGYARHTHGWGFNGGKAVAVNSLYVYLACVCGNEGGHLSDLGTWPPKGSKWYGISRRQRIDMTKAAPFPGGKGGKGETLKECFLPIVEVGEKESAPIVGLAANDKILYVSDPKENRVRVLDAATMQETGSLKVDRPGALALDKGGFLWVLQTGPSPKLLKLPGANVAPVEMIAFGADVVPTSFALGPDGTVYVADDGVSQQILTYHPEKDQLKQGEPIGKLHGIYAPPEGAFGDLRFNRPSAVGCDASGNLYVAHHGSSGGGSTVLESYNPQEKLLWRLFGLTFVDMAATDPAKDTDAYTKEEHFRMDYAKPAGGEWSYAGYTIQRFKYPDDPRLHIWSGAPWVRTIAGRRFLFVNDMNADYLQVYRLDAKDAGEIAIPSGLFAKRHIHLREAGWPAHQPEKGEWIWRDGNGNGTLDEGEFLTHESEDAPAAQGWWVDLKGDVWLATEHKGIRFFPQQGLDAQGNPTWTYAAMHTFPHPAGFDAVKRLRYDAEHDVMYLGGTSSEDKNQHWKPMGPVLARYNGWRKAAEAGRAPELAWKIVLPYEHGASGHESCEPMGFDVAGDFVFVPYTGASKAMGFSTGHVEVFQTLNGKSVGNFEPSSEVGEIGLQDLRETLTAHRRADGEYVVFMEDDYKAKVLMYRWKQ